MKPGSHGHALQSACSSCHDPRADLTVTTPIERILGITERVLDVPIRAVVGGLHLPVHPAGTPLVPQAVLGNPYPPWRPIGEPKSSMSLTRSRHAARTSSRCVRADSTPWTFEAFTGRFGGRYRTLRAGEELRISAATARARPA